jgi:DNA-binding transcriptional MerR regulator
MMNNTQKSFSIRDLENLSGIKAHTIRIWEKRYGLLSPERTETNIRRYSLESLQKLLNITLLYSNGYKISKIAGIPDKEIPLVVREIVAKNSVKSHAINAFKMAMMNFDHALFHSTYNNLITDKSFREIFWDVFIPFLEELGLLWQTSTISPAHEHFISSLIKQKLVSNIDKLQSMDRPTKSRTFVLFLPENEIHEIGLLFLHYEILLRGYQTVYLGATMPLDFLPDLQKYFKNLVFLSYFTVMPTKDGLAEYISEFDSRLNLEGEVELWILGQQTRQLANTKIPSHVHAFDSIHEVLASL